MVCVESQNKKGWAMDQMSFGDAEYVGKRKQTRREIFLGEIEQVVPWALLLNLIEPVYPIAGGGRHPYPLGTMLRIHLMQNWFGLSDPAMEETLYENAPVRAFAHLSLTRAIPDETTILNVRHLLEEYELAPEIPRRPPKLPHLWPLQIPPPKRVAV